MYISTPLFCRRNDDQLLVVAATAPHSLVEDDLTSGCVDHLGQGRVALLSEVRLPRMRSPQQPADLHTSSGCVGKDAADLGTRPIEEFIPVTLPIREEHTIPALERHQRLVKAPEICSTVNEHFDLVARRPCNAVTTSTVDRRRHGPPVDWSQEPIIETQRPISPRDQADHVLAESDVDSL
jgi:hypothetical protein